MQWQDSNSQLINTRLLQYLHWLMQQDICKSKRVTRYKPIIITVFVYCFQENSNTDPLSKMKQIQIKCLWDNPILYKQLSPPMYMVWKQNETANILCKNADYDHVVTRS